MKNHGLWMVIGCGLPLLLIFLLPAFGIRSDISFFIFIVLMFVCHLLMMGNHHGGQHGRHDDEEEEVKHESH